jgi:hypothetical protein
LGFQYLDAWDMEVATESGIDTTVPGIISEYLHVMLIFGCGYTLSEQSMGVQWFSIQ